MATQTNTNASDEPILDATSGEDEATHTDDMAREVEGAGNTSNQQPVPWAIGMPPPPPTANVSSTSTQYARVPAGPSLVATRTPSDLLAAPGGPARSI